MKKHSLSESGLFNPRILLAFSLCSVAALIAIFSFAAPTTNTITVNSTSPVIANDGFCTLPEAIISANTDTASGTMAGECAAGSGADTIVLQTGATYSLVAPHNTSYGFNGLPQITSNIAIEGNGAIIERNSNAPLNFRLFYIAPGGNLTLHNTTVRTGIAKGGNGGGGSAGAGGGAGLGGAIYNQGALTLNAVTLNGNRAQGGNGGLSAAGLGSGGGGLGGDGGTSTGGTPGGGGGGGMGGNGGAAPGSGGGGGGGANLNEHGQPNAGPQGGAGGGTTGGAGGNGSPLVGTSGANGGAGGGGGGGGNGSNINNGGNGGIGGGGGGGIDATATAGTGGFGGGGGSGGAANSFGAAGGFGGGGGGGGAATNFGLGGFGGGKALFDGGGGGGMGGAIFNDGGTLTITNSTLSGNTAIGGNNGGGVSGISGTAGDGLGGGIFNFNGSVTIDFSTIESNTVTAGPRGPGGGGTLGQARGGALYNYTTNGSAGAFIRNSILADSVGPTDCINDPGATLISTGYNLVRTPGTCGFAATGDLTGVDPKLQPLANNGGPTSTHALQNSSQAVERIPNGVNGCQSGVSVDQRGAPRAGGGAGTGGTACDTGAFEFNSSPGAMPTPTPTPAPRPRFFNYLSPTGIGDSAGEPSIGSNWTKEQIFTNHNVNGSTNSIPNGGSTLYFGGFLPSMLKITFNDCSSPASALWEEKPLLGASTPRVFGDPILFTDHATGRTFCAQLEGLTPAGSTIDITDDDGDNFTPSDGVIPSDVDHETIGGGIYHASDVPIPHPLYDNAIYYASQSVGEARALRSDNGGLLFSQAAAPMYSVNDCAGLHGHIKVSPADGTVYVPNVACGGSVPFHETGARQTLLVSENNGITWTQRPIPDSTTTGNGSADNAILGTRDPSVGVATDGTVYFGYQGADGHPRIAVSHNKGQTWSPSVDVGIPVVNGGRVLNCAFPAVVAGDPNRAAFTFFGTETGGENWQCGQGDDCSLEGSGLNARPLFTGVWYLYVASTYDGGTTWTTENITPGNPVQRGGICNSSTCRNLLDFFDATIDKEGRILIGYDDGCITASCLNGGNNDFTAKAAIARQSGGKRMFGAFDPAEPVLPGAPVLSGNRNAAGDSATLSWTAPDNGGSAITGYKIYRKISTDAAFSFIAITPVTNYTDGTLNPSFQYNYHVTAVNIAGEGPYCSDVTPIFVPNPVTPPACVVPGVLAVNDVNPDGTDNDSAQNTPPDPTVNVRELFLAEPCFGPGVNKLVFTMHLAPSTAASAPPSSQWYIIWNRKTIAADGSDRRYVAMKTDAMGAVTFDYGNFGPALPIGGVPPPNANTPTSLGSADSGSYNVATGVATITLASSKADDSPGLVAGDSLTGLNVRTYLARPDAGQKSQNNANDITGDGIYTLFGNGACCGPVPLLGIASRKTHTGVGPFDINLPLSPNPIGIECRTGGANGNHQIVFTFANPLTNIAGASITGGSGSIASSSIQNTFEYVVNLTGVTNAQRVTVTLTGVRDTAGDRTDTLPVTIGVLLGDTNADGSVNSSDIGQTKSQSFHTVVQGNFREDVNADGSINSSDIGLVKSKSFTALPP